MNADVVIVGAGPAGIFTALEMIKKGSRQKIVMVEKGQPVEKRHCPKDKTKKCVNCKPYCHITTGFSGAGAFSDGKLSLSYEVGGDLPTLIGADLAQETIDYADQIYLEFGADEHIEGLGHEEERKEIRRRAIQAGLKLVDCPIRHMGTEKAQGIYLAIERYLQENGVEMYFGYECSNLTRSARAWPSPTARRTWRSTPSIPWWPPAAGAPTGWRSSAPSTTSPTPPALWTSASGWRSATRSWRW